MLHEVYGKTKNNSSLKTHPNTGQAVDPKIRFQGQWEDVETGFIKTLIGTMTPTVADTLTTTP
jgi:hypothetical protein